MIHELQISIFLSIIFFSITYFGIKIIYKKFSSLVGECSYNEKSSLYHEKLLRGLGIIYPISIIPILFFDNQLINFYDYLFLLSLVLLGFIDDKYSLNYKFKFIFFIIISFIYNYFLMLEMGSIVFTHLFINIFFLVFFIVFFNQIDGINGIAIFTFIISLFFISLLNGASLTYLPIVSVFIPYLFINLKGKIGIQGDSGSYFLAGIFFIGLQQKFENFNHLISIIFICPILIDLIVTTFVKVYCKDNIFEGHRDNLYQKLATFKNSHLFSTLSFSSIQIFICLISYYLFKNYNLNIFLLIMFFVLSIIFFVFLILSYKINKHKL